MPLTLGIDMGTRNIKAAIYEGSFGRFNLQGFHSTPVAQDDRQLQARQLEAVEILIQEVTGSLNFTSVISFPCDNLSTRQITLPFSDQNRIKQILPYQLEDQIPFDIEDVTTPYRILSLENDQSDLFTIIVPNEKIRDYLLEYQAIGVDPKHLLVDADVLSNFSDGSIQVIIDLGYRRTTCTLCRDGKAIDFRAVPVGLQKIVNNLHSELNLSLEETEELLQLTNFSPNSVLEKSDHSQTVIQNSFNALQMSIRRVLIAFEEGHQLDIDQVLMCGGGAELKGIIEAFQEDLGVPVEKTPIPLQMQEHEADLRFALAYQIGQKATGETHGREFDLRMDDFAYQGNVAGLKKVSKLIGILIAVVFLLGTANFAYQWSQNNAAIGEVENDIIAEIKKTMPETESLELNASAARGLLQGEVEEMQEQVKKLGSITSDTPPTLSLMHELSIGMPSPDKAKIDVSELIIAKNKITAKAKTDSYETASLIVNSIKKRPPLKQAQKSNETKRRQQVEFTIVIPLGEPQTTEEKEE